MIGKRFLLLLVAVSCLGLATQIAAQEPTEQPAAQSQQPAEPEGVVAGDETVPPAAPAAAQQEPAPGAVGQIGAGAREAGAEAMGAARSGGEAVAAGTRALWREILLPTWQRLAAAIPGMVKAILVLLFFWIAAVVLGAATRRALLLTEVDNRAAKEWGLEAFLKRKDGKQRSIEQLAGSAVKWIILLFGFVAFFQALDLNMVAGPLQGVIDTIAGVVPSLLEAFVILLVYWAIASLVRLAVSRGLQAVGFDERAKKYLPPREVRGKELGPSDLAARLLFYVILIFGLAPFLEALGQTSLVEPLSEMLARALGFIPNIVAALVLFFVGRVVATIVREVVSNLLAASGADAGAERLGLSKVVERRKLSDIVGAIAYFFILVPAIVAAVDSLQIEAISTPIETTMTQVLAAVPLIFAAAIVVAIGVWLARFVGDLVRSFLERVGVDSLPERIGLAFLKPKEGRATLSSLGGTVVTLVIVLFTAEQALATLKLDQLAGLVGTLIAYLPQLVVGLAIVLAALSLSSYAARLVAGALSGSPHASLLAAATRWAIVFLGLSMGLSQLGVADEVVLITVAAVLGGSALALGLAFGLGGRERAKEIIEAQRGGGAASGGAPPG